MSLMTDLTRYRASDECEVAPFGEGVALLDLRSSTYFSLNETGHFIFESLRTPKTTDEVTALVADRYEIGADECSADVRALLADLASHHLVERL